MSFGKNKNGLFSHFPILIVFALTSCSGGAATGGGAFPGTARESESRQGATIPAATAVAERPSSVATVDASPAAAPKLTAHASLPTLAVKSASINASSAAQVNVFSDDFQEQNLNQWSGGGGTFSICQPAGNFAACSGTSSNNALFAGSTSWTDYTMQAAVSISAIAGGREGADIVVRAQDSNHFYELELVKETDGSQQWEMWRNNAGGWSNLARGYTNFATGGTYLLRLQAQGPVLTASVSQDNGSSYTVLGSAADSAYASGQIGLRAWGGMAASFDNVLVSAQSGPTPTSSPTQQPTQPPFGKLGDVVNGCQIWPKDDFWNLDITNAPIDSGSGAMIAKASSATGGRPMSSVYQSQVLNSLPGSAPPATMHQAVSYHQFPQRWPVGPGGAATAPVPISQGGDGNLLAVSAPGFNAGFAGNPCVLWQTGTASYSQASGYTAYNGAGWDVSHYETVQACTGCAGGGSTGIAQRPFMVRNSDILNGSLAHAIDGEFPQAAMCGNGDHLYPAAGDAQGNAGRPCLPGAAKIRLHASFSEAGLSADAVTLVQGLKHFGIAVVDNGCCFGTYWGQRLPGESRNMDVNGINAALSKIHVTDFDVIQLGPLNGASYKYPGVPGP